MSVAQRIGPKNGSKTRYRRYPSSATAASANTRDENRSGAFTRGDANSRETRAHAYPGRIRRR